MAKLCMKVYCDFNFWKGLRFRRAITVMQVEFSNCRSSHFLKIGKYNFKCIYKHPTYQECLVQI